MAVAVAAPDWGRHDGPPVVMLYGPPDAGKTIMLRRAAPHDAIVFAPFGATRGDHGVVGWVPEPWQRREVRTIFDVLRLIARYAKQQGELHKRDIRWAIIDDLTVLAEDSMPLIESLAKKHYPTNKYGQWILLMELLRRFRRTVRGQLGMGALLSGHMRGPETTDGILFRGGPRFPSKGRTEDLAKLAEIVGLVQRAPGWRKWPMWDGVLRVGHDPDNWFGRDRYGYAPTNGPANLRALLRIAGYPMPYPPGCEWMERVRERAYALRLERGGESDDQLALDFLNVAFAKLRLRPEYVGDIGEDMLTTRILWAVADGIDEAVLRLHRRARLTALCDGTGEPVIVPEDALHNDDVFSSDGDQPAAEAATTAEAAKPTALDADIDALSDE